MDKIGEGDGIGVQKAMGVRWLERDPLEAFVVVCDCSERRDNPFGIRIAREHHLFESCRFREVDRLGRRRSCKCGKSLV